MTTTFTQHDAVTKMSSYINYLAAVSNKGQQPLHIKQASFNGLVKLSQALQDKQDLIEAIKLAYPEKDERSRWKLAQQLTKGLAGKLRKAAANKEAVDKKAMGNMGAAGGVLSGMMGDGAGGGGGAAPGTGMSDGGAGQPGGGAGGAGIQTAPSYSTTQAVGSGVNMGMAS